MRSVAALQAHDLTLAWQDEVIVEGASFSLVRGELVCLVGRSGSGKTTLFHALAGLIEPVGGRVLLNGADVTGRPGQVSYMLQKDLLLPERRLLDNVALPLLAKGMGKKEARARAAALLPEFGLEGAERAYPHQLSGGMRQRAALLRTLLMDDEVILMDEPFSALDALTRATMRGWFVDRLTAHGSTAMLITHDVDEALSVADRILVLAKPGLRGAATIVGEVVVDAPRDSREAYLLSPAALDAKRKVLALLSWPSVEERSGDASPQLSEEGARVRL